MSPRAERRGAPRITHQLPLRLASGDQTLSSTTKNVSASGAYCVLTRFVAPMTKLRIQLSLPGASRAHRLSCQGVVVRSEPPVPTPRCRAYHVAIFFNDLSEQARARLAAYVQRHLQPTVPATTTTR